MSDFSNAAHIIRSHRNYSDNGDGGVLPALIVGESKGLSCDALT
ncbi:MAG: hypothetical protein ACFHU9_12295 [Fluviicola sp.]